jgi:transformation/transcription domain-associated protein
MKQAISSTASRQPCAETTSTYRQYIRARVKMALRHHVRVIVSKKNMEQFQDEVVQIVFRLFNECPPDAVASRKELLFAFRHLLNSELRKGFFNQMDLFIRDDRILFGSYRVRLLMLN